MFFKPQVASRFRLPHFTRKSLFLQNSSYPEQWQSRSNYSNAKAEAEWINSWGTAKGIEESTAVEF